MVDGVTWQEVGEEESCDEPGSQREGRREGVQLASQESPVHTSGTRPQGPKRLLQAHLSKPPQHRGPSPQHVTWGQATSQPCR